MKATAAWVLYTEDGEIIWMSFHVGTESECDAIMDGIPTLCRDLGVNGYQVEVRYERFGFDIDPVAMLREALRMAGLVRSTPSEPPTRVSSE